MLLLLAASTVISLNSINSPTSSVLLLFVLKISFSFA